MRWLGLAALLVLLTSGCTSKAHPSPPTQAEPPAQAPGPESSGIATPPSFTGSFWWPDKPAQLRPTALGKLAPVKSAILTDGQGQRLGYAVDHVTLEATLPKVPAELPVYLSGVYTRSHKFSGPPGWQYVPDYALIGSGPTQMEAPPGPDLAARAANLLKQYDLLLPDSMEPKTFRSPDGRTRVAFFRHVADLPVYGDKPACVDFDKAGTVTSVLIRRRPLLEVSIYPTRTPEQAWQEVQQGAYLQPSVTDCQDGTPWPDGRVLIPEFHVTSVELAYWEHHVDTPRQTMLPYYVFRNREGVTLYVPAIAPEWMQTSPPPGT